jgi:AraC-like DNA-binding protein
VLSVGLSVGFNSQSSFYSAFRDIAGTVPSRYRSRATESGDTAADASVPR